MVLKSDLFVSFSLNLMDVTNINFPNVIHLCEYII